MTKAEILERIDGSVKAQKDAIVVVNELLKSVSMSGDAAVLAAILHTMTGCICDTMNNLSLILCEMMPEDAPEKAPEKAPEPKKGEHYVFCNEKCQCVTCVNDNSDGDDEACCTKHGFSLCCVHGCPDYVKEDPDA